MDVIVLEEKQYCVAVLGKNVSGKTESDVMNYLADEKAGNCSLTEALAPIFEMYAQRGRNGVTTSMFHEVSKENGIWQFRKGNHCIFFFKDPECKRLVLLTHGNRKTGRKVDKSDVRQAVRMRDLYLEQKRLGKLRKRTLLEVSEENANV